MSGKDICIDGLIRGVSPAAKATSIDVRTKTAEGDTGGSDADAIGVRQWLRRVGINAIVPPRVELLTQFQLVWVRSCSHLRWRKVKV